MGWSSGPNVGEGGEGWRDVQPVPDRNRIHACKEEVIAVFNWKVTVRASRSVEDVLVEQVSPSVKPVEVDKPAEDLDLLGGEGFPDDGEVVIRELCGESRVSATGGERAPAQQSPDIRRGGELYILQ